jgi:hypothetical protein
LDCVPLDTQCLTRDCWRNWVEVEVGDETLGYNPETGRLEWTPILAKRVEDAQPIIGMRVGNWRARTTPGHRWWGERRTSVPVDEMLSCPTCGATGGKRGPFQSTRAAQTHLAKVHGIRRVPQPYHRVEGFVQTDSITKAHRLRVAAAAGDGAGNDRITADEAALLGWVIADGSINHAARTVNVWIYQAKPKYITVIDALLADVPHNRYVRDRRPGKHLPSISWRLSAPYARDLLARSALLDMTPEAFVLSLDGRQRERWLEAAWQAEGWTVVSGTDGEVKRLSQNVRPWADAMTLAVFLCGYRPTRHQAKRYEEHHSQNWIITLGRPWIGGTVIQRQDLGEHPVWCVQTAVGTWTMRQGGLPMLSGGIFPSGTAGIEPSTSGL